tara:strand:- start:871 stop:1032 length:162 start_codon:yes stop_codon:yes gene_type:complete
LTFELEKKLNFILKNKKILDLLQFFPFFLKKPEILVDKRLAIAVMFWPNPAGL